MLSTFPLNTSFRCSGDAASVFQRVSDTMYRHFPNPDVAWSRDPDGWGPAPPIDCQSKAPGPGFHWDFDRQPRPAFKCDGDATQTVYTYDRNRDVRNPAPAGTQTDKSINCANLYPPPEPYKSVNCLDDPTKYPLGYRVAANGRTLQPYNSEAAAFSWDPKWKTDSQPTNCKGYEIDSKTTLGPRCSDGMVCAEGTIDTKNDPRKDASKMSRAVSAKNWGSCMSVCEQDANCAAAYFDIPNNHCYKVRSMNTVTADRNNKTGTGLLAQRDLKGQTFKCGGDYFYMDRKDGTIQKYRSPAEAYSYDFDLEDNMTFKADACPWLPANPGFKNDDCDYTNFTCRPQWRPKNPSADALGAATPVKTWKECLKRCETNPECGAAYADIRVGQRTCQLLKTKEGTTSEPRVNTDLFATKKSFTPPGPNARFLQNMNNTHQQPPKACFDGSGSTDPSRPPGYMRRPCDRNNNWQQWEMVPVPNDPGNFQLKSLKNNNCLDAATGNYQYASCDPKKDLQKWQLVAGSRGGQMIKNKSSALCLDAGGSSGQVYLAKQCQPTNDWHNWVILGPDMAPVSVPVAPPAPPQPAALPKK